ncbi:hypothetical protein ACLOJK_010431 [Asimina triloba]
MHMPQLVNFSSLCFFLLVIGAASAKTTTLKAGVPAMSPDPKFVSVKCNDTRNETCFSGHAINVFRMVWKNLNYSSIDYEFIPYKGNGSGSYDSLIEQVKDKVTTTYVECQQWALFVCFFCFVTWRSEASFGLGSSSTTRCNCRSPPMKVLLEEADENCFSLAALLDWRGRFDWRGRLNIARPNEALRFDLVVGDTSILSRRCEYVEFSGPYIEVGMRMVVAEKREGRAWIIVKPFTAALWGVAGVVFLYNALIMWSIETADSEDKYSFTNVADLGWLILVTLFPVRGEKLNSNLSRMVMLGWLFLALVLLLSYTASLTSMLTVRRLRPSVVTVESLLKEKAMVGCDNGSFMRQYLLDEVGFEPSSVRSFNTCEYAQALSDGTIKAAFLEIPNLQIFLDENPKGFIAAGRTYEIGGHAFVFQKGSHLDYLVEAVSLEILKLREKGVLRDLEQGLLSHSHRSTFDVPDDDDPDRLSPDEFLGLFLITVSISTLALLLFLVGRRGRKSWPKVHPAAAGLEFRIRSNIIGDHPGLHHPNITKLRDLRRCNTKLDAVVGDVSVFAKGLEYIEYSRPYTATGTRMVVLAGQQHGYAGIFAKPNTKKRRAFTVAVFLYNGLIVWFTETVSSGNEKGCSFSNVGNGKESNLVRLFEGIIVIFIL